MQYILGSLKSAIGRQLSDAISIISLFPFPFLAPRLESLDSRALPDLVGSEHARQSEHDARPNSPATIDTRIERQKAPPTFSFVSANTTTKPPILDLPCDVLYLVTDHLDTASTYALALTCRNLYCAGFPKTQRKLKAHDKKALLTLLERDRFAEGYYYCYKCNKLHNYRLTCGPNEIGDQNGLTCKTKDVFAPTGNPFGLGYHHARLVMNRHFFGSNHGISIDNICVGNEVKRGDVTISCSTSANIIRDELFIKRSYDFTVGNSGVVDFRKCTGHRDFRLCEHLPFFRASSVYQQGIPELQLRPRGTTTNGAALGEFQGNVNNNDQFVACYGAPGSCGLCLLDYDITIQRIDDGEAWKVKINVYHQLGECRSPDDWKWARFTERSRPHLFLPNRPNRRGSGYSPGSVKRMWVFSGGFSDLSDENFASGNTARHMKRHSI